MALMGAKLDRLKELSGFLPRREGGTRFAHLNTPNREPSRSLSNPSANVIEAQLLSVTLVFGTLASHAAPTMIPTLLDQGDDPTDASRLNGSTAAR